MFDKKNWFSDDFGIFLNSLNYATLIPQCNAALVVKARHEAIRANVQHLARVQNTTLTPLIPSFIRMRFGNPFAPILRESDYVRIFHTPDGELNDLDQTKCVPDRNFDFETCRVGVLSLSRCPHEFRPILVPDSLFTREIRLMAESIWKNSDFAAMPILGDLLEESGWTCREAIAYCRQKDKLYTTDDPLLDTLVGRYLEPR